MELISRHEVEGQAALLISTGLSDDQSRRSTIARLLAEPGFILDRLGTVSPWNLTGTIAADAKAGESTVPCLQAFGPDFPGVALNEAVGSSDNEWSWGILRLFARSLSAALSAGSLDAERLQALSCVGPASVIAGDDGRFLILPSRFLSRCLSLIPDEQRPSYFEHWLHPDHQTLSASANLSFMFGTLARRVLTGAPAFPGSAPAEIITVIQDMDTDPLLLSSREIRDEICAALDKLLFNFPENPLQLFLDLPERYSLCLDASKATLPPSADFLTRLARDRNRRKRKKTLRLFFRKNSFTIKVIAGVAASIVILFSVWFSDMKNKPTTRGLSPLAVTEMFYDALSEMDSDRMTAASGGQAGKDYQNYTVNLFVTSSIREVYERGAGLITPLEFFERKELGRNEVFGVTGLEIKTVRENAEAAEYLVDFYLWSPAPSETAGVYVQGILITHIVDTVYAQQKKNRWVISAIASVSREEVFSGLEQLLVQLEDGSAWNLPYAPQKELSDTPAP